MGVIKVETLDVDVSSIGQIYNLSNALPSISSGFYRNTNSRGHSGGPVGSTSNAGPDDMSGYGFVSSTTQLTLGRLNGTVKMAGEVWRYTGAASGPDEFIVRDRVQVTLTNAGPSTGNAVSGVVDRNKCVCFITGKTCNQTNRANTAEMGAIAYLDNNGDLTVERGSGTSTLIVYVTVVEFTGSNWTVGYSKFAFSNGTKTAYLDSRGDTGANASIDWNSSMIIEARQSGGNGANDAIEDMAFVASAGTATTVDVAIDGGSANTGDGFVYVLQHPNLAIGRTTANKTISNNNTYVSEAFPPGVTLTDLEEASVEWTVTSDGSGTAHGRGSLNARLTALTTIQSWVHRSGNTGTYRYGAANLSGINGVAALVITSVDGDDIFSNSQNGVIISGSEFEAIQGTGTVILAQNADGSGTTVSQTVTNWSDTSITIDFNAGVLADTNSFIIVTNDSGGQGVRGVQAGVPPRTYTEVLTDLGPDHLWILDSTYTDEIAALNWSVRSGSPTFTANPLTRGRTNAWTVSAQGQEAGPNNSTNINDGAIATRTMGGFIRFTQIQDSFVMFYEEGGGINNIAFFMGIGGILIAQLADTGDDNVHAYSDFPLQPNRTYHIAFRFDYTQGSPGDRRFELFVDGVLQSSTFGNNLTSSGNHLDSHTGDIAFGDSGDSLEVFGTDINFPVAVTCYYQDWATWTDYLTETQIRDEIFVLGVVPDNTISSGTESAMQTAIDVFADTFRGNSACNFEIESCTDGDFELNLDNITFDDFASIHVLYQGQDTLTLVNLNGSNVSKIETPNGGNVVIVTPAQVTVSGLETGSEVRIYEAGTTNEIGGIESSGTSFSLSVQTASVDISVLSLAFQNIRIKAVASSSDVIVPVVQRVDRQYENQ